MEQAPIYSVSQVNQHIKALLDRDRGLASLFVQGEISNYKLHSAGNHYFSLKDDGGALPCVMFRREAASLRFRPENGMKVIAHGRVSVFPRDGKYQLYCDRLTPDGIGELYLAFEQLKDKLFREGLFNAEHKKPIPQFPGRIGLITSPTGDAVRDMIRILGARWPMAKVLVIPVRVQGVEAPGEIASAIAWADKHQVADLLITGRGGGSMEDLWAFNSELVARAIYACRIPIISAVGHEPDVTIADFVADLRAATPSNAAELAVRDRRELYKQLEQAQFRMTRSIRTRLDQAGRVLERAGQCRALKDPLTYVEDRREELDFMRERLGRALSARLTQEKGRYGALAGKLDAMSPLKVLARGYAAAETEQGTIIHSVKDVQTGQRLSLRVSDGRIPCRVE